MHAQISRRTLTLFAKTMSYGFVASDIQDAFAAEGLEPTGIAAEHAGVRRSLFETFAYGVDQSVVAEVEKLAEALGYLFGKLGTQDQVAILASLSRDGFELLEDGRFVSTRGPRFTMDAPADFSQLVQRSEDLRKEARSRPNDAVGHAREMIESTCKTILEDLGLPSPKGMKDLVGETLGALDLVPAQTHESKQGADAIKATLVALNDIVQGVSQLRLLYSGHGVSIRRRGLQGRHALLVVGSAITFVEFIVATHAERGANANGPQSV